MRKNGGVSLGLREAASGERAGRALSSVSPGTGGREGINTARQAGRSQALRAFHAISTNVGLVSGWLFREILGKGRPT